MTVAPPAPIRWAQRADKVFITIDINDVTNEQIKVDPGVVSFKGTSGGTEYNIDLELNNEVVPEHKETRQKCTGREVFFQLQKKDPGPFWPRLLKDTKKHHNIRPDFSRWKDEDDTDDEDAGNGGGQRYDDASLEDMMQQMGTGGAGDFDPDEGCSDDSDDDDLPELEGENGAKVNGDS